MRRGDGNIRIGCPWVTANLLETNANLNQHHFVGLKEYRRPETPTPLPQPRNNFAASALENLWGRDGISKTGVWKKYACFGELRMCENVPVWRCRCDHDVSSLAQ